VPQDYTTLYIERLDDVPDDKATPAKADAADKIEELWGLNLSQIAERSGYSRQHIKNALDDYFSLYEEPPGNADVIEPQPPESFEPDEPEQPKNPINGVEIPDGVHANSYLKGLSIGAEVEDLDSFLEGAMKAKMAKYD